MSKKASIVTRTCDWVGSVLGVRECPQSHSNTTTPMRGSGSVVGVRECPRKPLSQQQLGIGSGCVLGVV